MKKAVFLLLIAGFIASNFYADKESKFKNNPVVETQMEEVQTIPSSTDDKVLGEYSEKSYLLLTLKEGNVHKAIMAKTNNNSETIEMTSIPNEQIEPILSTETDSPEGFEKDAHFKERLAKHMGISIDHIIVFDKKGYIDVYSKLFPNGVNLNLTEEMKKDLDVSSDSKEYSVKNPDELLKVVKMLTEDHQNKEEIYSMLAQSFTKQILKPDTLFSLFTIANQIHHYIYTDLSIDELLSFGFHVMKKSGSETDSFELPETDQQVIETTPYDIYNF
ncbi:hypothetical protein [Neobacillus sp. D3-1R]|uniref:hypothetical protein n=1 Tax=Neobacillus sp. D3-1R TaxID=3445778 RepID=UPI003F9FD1E1